MGQRSRRTVRKSRGRTAAVAGAVALGALVTRPASAADLKDYKNNDDSKQDDVIAHGSCTPTFASCTGAVTIACDLTKDEYVGANYQTLVFIKKVNSSTGTWENVEYGPLHNAGAIGSTTSATYHPPAISSPYYYDSVFWQICDDGIHSVNNVVCDQHTQQFIVDNGKC